METFNMKLKGKSATGRLRTR